MTTYRSTISFGDRLGSFAQRQPQLFFVGALAGGFLLGYFLKNIGSRPEQSEDIDYAREAALRFADRAEGGRDSAGSSLPSARLGATEDQIEPSMQQSAANAVPRDEVSTTGTAYELDPKSITGG